MATNIPKSSYNTLYGEVVIGDPQDGLARVGLNKNSVSSFLYRELGISKKITASTLYANVLTDPSRYLQLKIADYNEQAAKLEPIFTSSYINAIQYGESDEDARKIAMRDVKHYWDGLIIQHKQRFPPDITKKLKSNLLTGRKDI